MNPRKILAAGILLATMAASCKKDNNSSGNNGGGGGGGNNSGTVKITDVSPKYNFWGKEITITGSGFSTNKTDNIVSIRGYGITLSDTVMTADVVSATATKLVVKIPYKYTVAAGDTIYRGFDYGKFRVKLGDKMAIADSSSYFIGFPRINNICYTYGQQQYTQAVQPGDSVVMSCGINGINGNTMYFDSLNLYINGVKIPSAKRTVNAICGGLIFYLPPQDYCLVNNCQVPSPGVNIPARPARKMDFQLKIQGTDISSVRTEFWVINQPNTQVIGTVGGIFSKSAGGNPYGNVTGKYFHFKTIKWISTGLPEVTTDPPTHSLTSTDLQIFIPLSLLQANGTGARTYLVYGVTHCDEQMAIGQVTITP